MAVELKFLIDGADRGQPFNPEEFAITISEDDSIGLRVVSFNNDLTFGGGVFSYLFDKLKTSGYCSLIDVQVQYKCKSGWARLVDGYIIVTESIFLYDRCQVKTKIYDETFSTRINNNKSIPFSMLLTETKNLVPISAATHRSIRMFNPATGAYALRGYGVSIYNAFAHLVACMSDGMVDFDSDFFYRDETAAQTDFPIITNGLSIRSDQVVDIVVSFEVLFTALRNKLNLGMGLEKQANGRPLLRIEPISYFFQSNATANFYDQAGIELRFDTSRLYASVEFGAEPLLEVNECNGGNTACTFVQTPFRGFRVEKFGFTGECNTSNVLQLKTSDVVFDTNVIEDVYRFDSQEYDLNPIIIQSDFEIPSVGTPYYQARPYDPYGVNQTVYNGNFRNEAVSANWLNGYPNSLYSFLQGFDPADTPFYGQMVDDSQFWEIIDGTFTSFVEYNGDFVQFPEVTDVGSNYDGRTYIVPFTGFYTFTTQIILDPMALTGTKTAFASILHYDSNDQILQTINGTQQTELVVDFIVLTCTANIVCNQGDLIRADVSAKFNSPGAPTNQFILHDFTDPPNPTIYSYFEGSGVPLTPSELDPVNIDEVRAYLYKFNRSLTMDEINAITSNSSRPVKFGRTADPLNVINGYIKTINIESVLRKTASVELKSNLLLP